MKKIFALSHFTANEIKPSGWMRRELEIQAAGLSGNLDKIWPDIRDSAWIGGECEGWERVPYWLDGFIPLAWLLDDDDLKARAKKYIDGIIDRQCDDGWICPCKKEERPQYDVWAVFLICKVLVLYHECSADERIEKVVYSALKNLSEHLCMHTLFNWGQSRWFEAMIPILWLYERTGEAWLEELARMLNMQGLDYKRMFKYWRHNNPENKWNYYTHVVNLMMAIKSEAIFSPVSGENTNDFAEEMLKILSTDHGTAVGHISGDECLAGNSPIRGTELCSIAEAMYSYETLFEITGNPIWADRAEIAAFNSFSATVSEDMWTHQYDQMINQIACCKQNEPPVYGTNNTDANRFGLEPHFGCCTSNFNQVWPKFALSSYYRTENGIISAVLIPSEINCSISGANVSVKLETDYPFKGKLSYTVHTDKEAEFEFGIRIPAFAKSAIIDGKTVETGKIYYIKKKWNGTNKICAELQFEPKLKPCPNDTYCLQCGPLYYSVPIKSETHRVEYTKNGVERKFPYCDYDIYPVSDWNYAFASQKFRVIEGEIGNYPFSRSNPPVMIETEMAQINWGILEGQPNICNPYPKERTPLGIKTIRLQPYGCTTLRMTQMPYVK